MKLLLALACWPWVAFDYYVIDRLWPHWWPRQRVVNLDGKAVERIGMALALLLVPVVGSAAYGLLVLVARTLKWLAA